MARSVSTGTIRLIEPDKDNPFKTSSTVDLGGGGAKSTMEGGVQRTENADGSATFDFAPKTQPKSTKAAWFDNIADEIDEGELTRISQDLIAGIELDDQSRKDWLETRARGIALLGLKLNQPQGEATSEGVSKVQHPLLLEATLRFQANARGELLPASGPVKIRNDATVAPKPSMPPVPPIPPMGPPNPTPPMAGMPPPQAVPQSAMAQPPGAGQVQPPQPPPGGPPALQQGAMPPPPPTPPPPPPNTGMMLPPKPVIPGGMNSAADELAEALETDFNHYLTVTCPEYYPDTDRMLFWIGCGGQGIKKVYNCPLRQRPVSESIDAEDLIVSNAETNLENCTRITHRIRMKPSWLKRMQLIDAYLNVELTTPMVQHPDPVKEKKLEIQGLNPSNTIRPQDADHEVYECYCELDIAGFEHTKNGKPTGLRLPYVVTIHKDSRKILAVRRNWRKDDAMCTAKQYFVDFAFVRALGFYGIGLIHILGNTTSALTAAWRIQLDAGMFSSFPGFIYQKQYGRQLTNQFRVPPGGGVPLDVGTAKISDAVMPLPYKEPGTAFMQLTQNIEQLGQRVGGTAETAVGEGKQEAPVGTTLALIEQATKMMDAVHKRLTAAQAKEFQLLKERFQEDPEAFWRHNKKTALPWEKKQFLEALENSNLVPVADPNNPTSMHRIAKAVVIKTLQQSAPELYDPIAVDTRIMRITGIDPEGLFKQSPTPPPPNPNLIAAQAKAQSSQQQAQMQLLELQLKREIQMLQSKDKAADRISRERTEQYKLMLERLRIQNEQIIHGQEVQNDVANEATKMLLQHHMDRQQAEHDRQLEAQQAVQEAHMKRGGMVMDLAHEHMKQQGELAMEREKHEQEMQMEREKHEHEMALTEHERSSELEHKKKMEQQDRDTKKQEIASKERIAKIGADAQIKVAKAKPKSKPAAKAKK